MGPARHSSHLAADRFGTVSPSRLHVAGLSWVGAIASLGCVEDYSFKRRPRLTLVKSLPRICRVGSHRCRAQTFSE